MNRHLLPIIIALGVVVTLVSGAGVYAVFTDRATTGTLNVVSGEVAKAADLKLAIAAIDEQVGSPGFGVDCYPFSDDLTSDFMSVALAAPGESYLQRRFFCLKNTGSAPLDVTMSVIDLVDSETGCTGDEAMVDDTCGGAGQLGELGGRLSVGISAWSCMQFPLVLLGETRGPSLPEEAVSGISIPGTTLPANKRMCGSIDVYYPPSTTELVQAAQSDQTTWRLAYDRSTTP
jgi:hypothetical protein